MSMAKSRIGVLISGRGSNLQALIDAAAHSRLDADIAVVISNRPEAPGLEHARRAGIEAVVLSHRAYTDRAAFDQALADVLDSQGVDLVCLAGFMRVLGPAFCHRFPLRVLNVHPSLLPAFRGSDAQRQALEHGVWVAGATVRFVTAELDNGPIVSQAAVPVLDHDTVESLSARILAVEHRIYPEAVQRILHEPWRLSGRRVCFDDGDPEPRTGESVQ
jgi:phosphoribosylglycinamide formyltransferase-1